MKHRGCETCATCDRTPGGQMICFRDGVAEGAQLTTAERARLNWWSRLFIDDRCGPEAKFWTPARSP